MSVTIQELVDHLSALESYAAKSNQPEPEPSPPPGPTIPRNWTRIATHLFATIGLLVFSDAALSLILSGGANQSDTAAYNSSLIRLCYLCCYAISAAYCIWRWPRVLATVMRSPLLWPFLTYALMSCIWSTNVDASVEEAIKLVGTTCFALFLASEYNLGELLGLLARYSVVTIVLNLAMMPFPTFGWMSDEHIGRFRGAFIHKNVAGAVMGKSVGFLWCWCRTAGSRFGLVWLGLATAMLFMTQSVASLLNLNLATLGTLCLFPMRWKLESAIPAIATTIAVGYYSAIAISFNYESILIDLGRDPSLSGRTELWSLILQFVDDRLYFGHGIDAVFGQPAAESLISFIEGWPVPHAHNGWISLLLDYGIVGTALYAVWFGHTLFRAIVHFRNASPTTVWVAGFPIFFLLYILASSASEVSLFSVNRIELVLLLAIALSQPPSGFLAGLLRVPTLTKRFAAKGEI